MIDYKSNSNKSKEERREPVPEKRIERVTTGLVKHRKKNEIQKFVETFIPGDIGNVKSYILMDILVPGIKKTLSDIGHSFIDAVIPNGSKYIKNGSTASKVSYRSYYEKENDPRAGRSFNDSRETRTDRSYDDIVLVNQREAENVLHRMDELIYTYGLVSIADLYELVGVTGEHTDNKYGWTDMGRADVVRVRDGYLLKLPRPTPLG